MLGFATVGVNLRGTGCSGGAYDYFEELAVARRLRRDRGRRRAAVGRRTARSAWSASRSPASPSCSWPRPGRRTSPRSRRCRCSTTPTTRSIPGGIFNNGFALGWAEGPPGRRPARHARRRRAGVGPHAHRRRRRDLPHQPGAAAAGGRRDDGGRGPTRSGAARPPTRSPRRASCDEIDVPGVPRRRVAGPGDRQPLRQHARRLLARHPDEDHADERPAPGLARSRGARRSGSSSSTSTWPGGSRPSRRRPRAHRVACCWPRLFGAGATLAPDRFTDQPDYATALRAVRGGAARARAVRRRRRATHRCRRSRTTAPVVPAPRRPPPPRGTSAPTARSPTRAPVRHRAPTASSTTRARFPRTMDDGRRATTSLTPPYRLEAGARRQGARLRDRAARRRHRARRYRQRRPLGAVVEARRRPRGDDQRGAPRRQGDLRAERVAAGQPARASTTAASTDLLPVQTHTKADVEPLPATRGRRWSGCRCTRSPTRSARAPASASWCSRRAATARRGRSTALPGAAHGDDLAIGRAAVEGRAPGGLGRRRLDAAPRVRHAAGPTVSRTTEPSTNRRRTSMSSARLRPRRRTTSSGSPRSIRSPPPVRASAATTTR